MANFTSSPGVAISEIDNTFLTGQPVQAGAAIIGPTVKGPVEKPTLVTSYSNYVTLFGDNFISGGNAYSYLTSIAAYNYFNYGGTSLLVARVVSGSYTAATSSYMPTASAGGPTSGLSPFVLETLSEGIIMNNSGSSTSGALISGSIDNIRWEVTNSNTGSGTFNVLIRQGNDTTNSKIVLEAFNNVNLDPNSPRYIAAVIGDQKLNYDSANNQMQLSGSYPNSSRFVRVKSVNYTTPNYINLNGVATPAYTGSLPANGSGSLDGSFGGATGTTLSSSAINFYDTITTQTQGLIGSDYNNMINLFGNPEAYKFNILFTPGLLNDSHASQITNIILNTQNRGDNLFVLDLVSYTGTVNAALTQAQVSLDTSYAATYWPWVRIVDPATGKQVWVPASTVIPGVYAFNDKVAAPWFAPAGINRGGLSTVLQAQYKLTQANRDALYASNVNPIATLPKQGVVVYGQKTLQKSASALDRVNVRRLMIEMKNYIRQIADTVVFEQNTISTRNSFIAKVTPFLEGIQQKQGLYAYKVIMDTTNNGPAVIDNNQLIGQIYIQPTRTAEFISLDFILLPTGAEFPG